MSGNHSRSVPRYTERVIGDTTVVELRGDIDVLTAPRVSARLDMLAAGPPPDLVLDLRPVSFIDCAGLGLLCRARNRVRAQHGRLRLVNDSASFLRILRCAGLVGAFELHTRLPEALLRVPGTAEVSSTVC